MGMNSPLMMTQGCQALGIPASKFTEAKLGQECPSSQCPSVVSPCSYLRGDNKDVLKEHLLCAGHGTRNRHFLRERNYYYIHFTDREMKTYKDRK